MLGWAIALLLTFAPPDEAEPAVGREAPVEELDASTPEPAPSRGELVLIPTADGSFTVVDSEGRTRQVVDAGPSQPARVSLAPGIYYVQDRQGTTMAVAVIVESRAMLWDGHEVVPADRWTGHAPATEPQPAPIPPPLPISQSVATKKPNHKVWASPLASALIPGIGQVVNRQGGKAIGVLFGTLGSVVGAVLLYRLENDGGRSHAAEYTRLVAYGVLSSAAPMLWIYGIADAYRVAAERTIEPHVGHRVRFGVSRTMTVGFRADAQRPGFYDNWSASLMGQAARRLTVGVADLSFAPGGPGRVKFGQFGLRLDYRVYEHPRVWLDLGVGTTMQIASLREPASLDPDAAPPDREVKFAAIPYGYFDVRCFVLDRLSLDFTPRLSVPVTTRYFSASRALPRFAPTLELGVGVSVYF